MAPANPASDWSRTVTARVRPASSSLATSACEVCRRQRRDDASRAAAEEQRLLGLADLPRGVERCEYGLNIRVEPPVRLCHTGIAPGHDEHLLPRCEEVFDEAAAGGQVEDVELVDGRGDEQQRSRADLARGRCVLDQLEHRCAQHHRAGRDREVLADRELILGDHAGDAWRDRHVADEVPQPTDDVGPAGVDDLLERCRVQPRQVRGGRGVMEVVREEAHPQFVALVELRDLEQPLQALARREVGLDGAAQERVVVPGGVFEPAIARRRFVRRRAQNDAAELVREVGRLADDGERLGRERGSERSGLCARQEPMEGSARRVDQEGIEWHPEVTRRGVVVRRRGGSRGGNEPEQVCVHFLVSFVWRDDGRYLHGPPLAAS